jgi:hypothetical protein
MAKSLLSKACLFLFTFLFCGLNSFSQISLSSSPYIEDFNAIASGLPTGVSIKTGGTASTLGTDATLNVNPSAWNVTSSGFRNSASATSLTETSDLTAQSASSNRALTIRQSGSFGDPGGSFVFQIANTTNKNSFNLNFKLQSLDIGTPRSVTWVVDYAFGDTPTAFTNANANGTLVTGGGAFSNNTISINFGNVLDNKATKVWIRITTLTASTGSGNRPTTAIDDFNLSWSATGGGADVTAPSVISFTPADDATNISINNPLEIRFSELIAKGTGNIAIVNTTDNTTENIDVTSNKVTISNSTATISTTLVDGKSYAVNIPNTAFKDLANNAFLGINNNTIWNFSTPPISNAGTGVLGTAYNFNTCISGSNLLADGFYQFSITGDGQKWACNNFGRTYPGTGTSTDLGLQMSGFSGSALANEDWLISPKYNLSATTTPLLSYYTRTRFSGESLKLLVSTNYSGTGNPSSATWTEINGRFPAADTDVWTKSENISLGNFKQASVYIAFVYKSSTTDAPRWTIDDFLVENSTSALPAELNTSTGLVNFGFVANGSTANSQFTFDAANFTTNLTLSALAPYTISKDGTTFSNSLVYTPSDLSGRKTVTVKFAPTQVSANYSSKINFAFGTTSLDKVVLGGNTYTTASTFDVVNWNIEWFAGTNGPTDDVKQKQNAIKIMKSLNADLYAIAEIVDTLAFKELAEQIGTTTSEYGYYVSTFASSSPTTTSGSYGTSQKLGFIYRKSMVAPIGKPSALFYSTSTSDPAYVAFSAGRFPFELKANVTLNGVSKPINFIVLHAKAETNDGSYLKRKNGSALLKTHFDTNEPNDNFIILGDFNDDFDRTIATATEAGADFPNSPYKNIIDDVTRYSAITLPLSIADKKSTTTFNDVIDHVIISNEMKQFYISESADILTSVETAISPDNFDATTSDHYPVLSRYIWTTSTSIDKDLKANNSKLSIYPNPVKSDGLTILLDGKNNDNEKYEFTLISLDGRVVFSNYDKISASNILLNKNIKFLNQGIYILNIKGKDQSYSAKFIKE